MIILSSLWRSSLGRIVGGSLVVALVVYASFSSAGMPFAGITSLVVFSALSLIGLAAWQGMKDNRLVEVRPADDTEQEESTGSAEIEVRELQPEDIEETEVFSPDEILGITSSDDDDLEDIWNFINSVSQAEDGKEGKSNGESR